MFTESLNDNCGEKNWKKYSETRILKEMRCVDEAARDQWTFHFRLRVGVCRFISLNVW